MTLNTLVQDAWALLLNHYSHTEDVVFGATVSGRPTSLAGVESMIGLFINMLPVRVSVSPELLLLPWLAELHAKHVEREAYSYTPFRLIQEWSQVPNGVPLFESLLTFENYPLDKSLTGGIISSVSIKEVQAIENTNCPLTLTVFVNESELKFKICYVMSRFDAFMVTQMTKHLKTLLEGMITGTETKQLRDISLLTKAEP